MATINSTANDGQTPNLPFTSERLQAALRRHLADERLTLTEIADDGPADRDTVQLLTAHYHSGEQGGSLALACKRGFEEGSVAADDKVLAGADRREIRFYHELGTKVPLKLPTLVDSELEADPPWLLLTRLPATTLDRHAWQPAHYRRAVLDLAKLHAEFWEDHTLWQRDWLWRPTAVHGSNLLENARQSWQAIQRDQGQRDLFFEPQVWAAFLEQPEFVSQRLQYFPSTLVHGDPNASNVVLPSSGPPVWFDWQFVAHAPGLLDLVVLYTASAYWQREPPALREMLALYSEELSRLRVRLPWSSAMEEGLDAMLVWYTAIWWLPQIVRLDVRVGQDFAERGLRQRILPQAEEALARLLA